MASSRRVVYFPDAEASGGGVHREYCLVTRGKYVAVA